MVLRAVTIEQPQQTTTNELTKTMSRVMLKDDEIKRLKKKNSQVDQENKILREKVAKQKNKLKGKLQLHGAKHLLWDQINSGVDNFMEFLNYIEDKIALADSTFTKCQVVDEVLQQRPVNKAQSTIKFLKQASNETLRILEVKDRRAIMIWANKFIEKHNRKDDVKSKEKQMQKKCNISKEPSKICLRKDFLPFGITMVK